LSIIVSFSYIYISQGKVATSLTCGGIFTNNFYGRFSSECASETISKIG